MASNITTVKDLIKQAYMFSGSGAEGEEVKGERFQFGLYYLNQLITSANIQAFLPFAQVIKDLPAGYQVYILTEDEALASNQNEIPDEVKDLGPAKIIQIPQPKIINSVGYKLGIQFTALKRLGTPDMMRYTLPVKATPEFYSYEEFPRYTMLYLNRPSAFPVRITYAKNIEMVNGDDALNVPMQYMDYLLFGMAYRIAVKYQQPVESIGSIKALWDEACHNLKELNKNDLMITWADNGNPADGWFGSIFAPPNW